MKGFFIVILAALLITALIFTGQFSKKGSSPKDLVKLIDKSKKALFEINIRSIKNALDSYYFDNNKYPYTLEELIPKYLNSYIELIDPWGNKFKLETDEEMNQIIISAGRDGVLGNSDDIQRRLQ
jgi:hypothetical protein